MELLSKKKADKDLKFNAVGGREDNTRQDLATAVRATNQYGEFQKLGGQFFAFRNIVVSLEGGHSVSMDVFSDLSLTVTLGLF